MMRENGVVIACKKQHGFCRRLQEDRSYRRRFIYTMLLFWIYFGLGYTVGQMGPSFPDLQLIVKKDLEAAAWLFTVFSIGYLVGSLISGVLYNKCNRRLLLTFSIVMISLSTALVPLFESFPTMLTLRFVTGLGTGGIDTGANAELLRLWDAEGGPYMQALHLCYTFGGTISPLVLEPFLAKTFCTERSVEEVWKNLTNVAPDVMNTTSFSNSTDGQCVKVYKDTRIHVAYFITALILLSGGVPFIAMLIKGSCRENKHDIAENKANTKRPNTLPVKLKVILCVFLLTWCALYDAVENSIFGYLATFCLQQFRWDKGMGSYITSLLWAMMSFGRVCGVFLFIKFRPAQMIGAHLFGLLLSLIGLLVASLTYTEPLVWLSVASAGFSMSILFGGFFTWTEENIMRVSGMILSMFIVSSCAGQIVNSSVLGYLMETYGHLWFLYLLIIQACVCLIVFVVILRMVRLYVKQDVKTAQFDIYVVTKL